MIESTKFRDKRTGEIVTQFSILDIQHFEKVEEPKTNFAGINMISED